MLNALPDLENRVIRSVGSADHKIKEDILRSLRAIRFATVLNFKLDDKLKKAIIKHRDLLKNLSYQRKKEELDKIFSSVNAQYGIQLLQELKLLEPLDLPNLNNIVITSTSLGIWAQLDVLSCYPFTNSEKQIIHDIQKVLPQDILDDYVLYQNDLYACTVAGEIKDIDRAIIVAKHNELPIKSPKEIDIGPLETVSYTHLRAHETGT